MLCDMLVQSTFKLKYWNFNSQLGEACNVYYLSLLYSTVNHYPGTLTSPRCDCNSDTST